MKPIPKTPDGKTDWDAITRERLVAQAAFDAIPDPTEDTIEACATALKAEGFEGSASYNGVKMSIDGLRTMTPMTLTDWRSLLKDWRYLKGSTPTPRP